VSRLIERGFDPTKPEHEVHFRGLARNLNAWSRRGNINARNFFGQSGLKLANGILFGPRYRLSGLELVAKTPIEGFNAVRDLILHDKPSATDFVKTGMTYAATTAMLMGIAYGAFKRKYPDAKIEMDLDNTDCLRVKLGGTYYDFAGGLNIPIRDVFRALFNRRTSRAGITTAFDPQGTAFSPQGIERGVMAHLETGMSPFLRIWSDLTRKQKEGLDTPGDWIATLAATQAPMGAKDVWEEMKAGVKRGDPQWEGALKGVVSLAGIGVSRDERTSSRRPTRTRPRRPRRPRSGE
jgi:hypothetical protein